MKIISLGEILWDVFDEEELLGGAPLNFSASLQRLGHQVTLISAVGDDLRGERTLVRLQELGLNVRFVQVLPSIDTGVARVTLDAGGHASFVIPRPAAFDAFVATPELLDRIAGLSADWLYYGTLAQISESNLRLLLAVFSGTPSIRGFYDMNLRDGHWNLSLVQQLSALAKILKLNETEAEMLFRLVYPRDVFSVENFCHRWSADYSIDLICVTLGSEGCAVFSDGQYQSFPGYSIQVADTVGAGDAFAAGFLHGLSQPWSTERRAAFANALGALVASRAGATPAWRYEECQRLIAGDVGPVYIAGSEAE